jgi:hypothetical protein
MAARERPAASVPPTALERAAFELLTDAVSADSGVVVTAQLAPVVLTSAALLMAYDEEMRPHADSLISCLLRSPQADSTFLADIVAAADALKVSSVPVSLCVCLKCSPIFCQARDGVALTCLSLAATTTDRQLSGRALQLYCALVTRPTHADISLLAAALLVDVGKRADDDAVVVTQALSALARDVRCSLCLSLLSPSNPICSVMWNVTALSCSAAWR